MKIYGKAKHLVKLRIPFWKDNKEILIVLLEELKLLFIKTD